MRQTAYVDQHMTELAKATGLAVADVMHRHVSTLPATATVGELRAYFAASASRRLAILVDGGRYVGSVTPDALPPDAEPDQPVAAYVSRGAVLHVGASAVEARDRTLATPERRLPVVDDADALVGIVAIDVTLTRFCGA